MPHNETPVNYKENPMSIKSELIFTAVRILSDKTDLFPKPDAFSSALNSFFGVRTPEEELAEKVEKGLDQAVAKAKKINTNRKFKKITQDF